MQQQIEQISGKIPELLTIKRQSGDAIAQVIPSAPNQSDPVIYETIVCAIHAAKSRVMITTPYFVPDELLLTALTTAAKRGVECTILADAVGSGAFLGSEWETQLREAGVRIVPALPVGVFKTFFARSDLRNHRKILIVDNLVAYTGSFNLVDPRFFKQGAGVGEWVDVMMRCRGEMVLELAAVFYADVAVETDENLT